jgi:23S rRNA (cytidine1920-2'-O)/16S rRNA (cytidine1409-2'-O)-methyltransferase
MQGKVLVNGKPLTKPGTPILLDATITLTEETPKYVSRAGFKLEGALQAFEFPVKDLVALDAGISTGGFTDCLLQNGILRVYGIDVGYGQVHEKIRNDPRVILFEKTNLRYVESLPELVDLATLDLSFISLLKVMPAIIKLIKPNGTIIALIKPQFEAERGEVNKGGIITDPKIHQKVIDKITHGMAEFGFKLKKLIDSPILGGTAGNKEFLGLFVRE